MKFIGISISFFVSVSLLFAQKNEVVEISDLHALYSTLTSRGDAGRKQQVKRQIILLTNELTAAKKACGEGKEK